MKRQISTAIGLLSLAMSQLSAGSEAPKANQTALPSCDESLCKEWNSGYRASEGYGAYISASFIYSQMIEEGMEVATAFQFPTPVGSTLNFDNESLKFNFKYKPGFKVALGWNTGYDNWDLFAEYTWYHTGNMTTSQSAPGTVSEATETVEGTILFTPSETGIILANFTSRTLNAKFDFLDLMLAKSYCFGQKLLFRPSFGGRGAWIRQHLTTSQFSNQPFFLFPDPSGLLLTNNTVSSNNKTLSWGLGLKGALEVDWMLGYGLKFFGIGGADLLYTHYDLYGSISTQGAFEGTPFELFSKSKQKQFYVVRPHAELELGFNWGTHFSDCQYYFNLTAAYGFQVFWSQNMFLQNSGTALLPLSPDNLYLQGLRVTALFAF